MKKGFILIKPLLIALFILMFSIYIYSYFIEISLSPALTGPVSIVITMFGIIGLFILSFNKSLKNSTSKEQIKLLTIISLLALIYYKTAMDSFRYWIYIAPFLLLSILITSKTINKKVALLFLAAQLFFLFNNLPWNVLQTNYWVERFEKIDLSTYKSYSIYSSTPLYTVLKGYKSNDICNFNLTKMNEKSIVVIDEYSISKCGNWIKGLNTFLNNQYPSYIFSTNKFVEIDRYRAIGQNTTIYILN